MVIGLWVMMTKRVAVVAVGGDGGDPAGLLRRALDARDRVGLVDRLLDQARLAFAAKAQFARNVRAQADRSGGRAEGLKRLFMSHPPLEERIAALQSQAAA